MSGAVAAIPMAESSEQALLSRGWGAFLLVAVVLLPVVVPVVGPAQLAILDMVDLVAILGFVAVALVRRLPVPVPFAVPIFLMSVGSLLAVINSTSVVASLLALTKDAYLYIWFVVLVALLRPRGDLKAVRMAWLWAADFVVLFALVSALVQGGVSVGDLLIGGRLRLTGTFYNPNMLADYLMLSIFVALGLVGQVRRRYLAPSLVLLPLGMLLTKSNGGLISLGAGLLVWTIARLRARGVQWERLAGGLALGLAVALVVGWLHVELGVGRTLAQGVAENSYLGRVQSSSESRELIWRRLEQTYAHSPLGIGPKNSSEQTLAIGERERPDSFQSKEAHDDYLAYAVERGPLALVGLLLLTGQAFALVLGSRRRLGERVGGVRGGDALWAAFLGALAGTSVHSLVIEKLHFRHFWFFLAILVAMTAEVRVRVQAGVASRPAPDPGRAEPVVAAVQG